MLQADADRNLLFGVLALQGELIDPGQFAEACTGWSARKDRSLADHLVDRGWLSAEDRRLVEQLLERRLRKHSGDIQESLIAAASRAADARMTATLQGIRAGVDDEDIRQSLADLAHPTTATDTIAYLSPLGRPPESRDRYTLTSLHAKGGIGQVWLARDMSLDREVALKELRPDRSDDSTTLRRFLQEARITSQLDHPGVVPVYELARGEAAKGEGHPYYTMRFIRGRTLSEAMVAHHLKRESGEARRADLLALVQAFVGVCNTVAFAHNRGVIHRDLKGQNIVLGDFGEVILLDWGLAKLVDRDGEEEEPGADFDPAETGPYLEPGVGSDSGLTAAGQVLGTPAYMAPEQAEGRADRIGRLTDVYGLGAILYEILAGRPPFQGDSTHDVLRKVREEAPPPPGRLVRSAPKALEAICLKAMAKDPAGRYASVADLVADVQHWVADEPVSSWREPWPIRTRRWVGRHRTQVAAGVAALVVAVVGLTATLVLQAQANRDLQAALELAGIAREDAKEQSTQAEAAIGSFYQGITQDVILRRPELEQLRGKLLGTALKFYENRVKYLEGQGPRRSDDLSRGAFGLDRIASLQAMLGQRDSAIQTRRRLVELYDRDPTRYESEAAQARLDLGELQRLAGKPDDADRSLREALDRYERLVSRLGIGIFGKVARVQTCLGRLLFDIGRSDEGRRLLERARDSQEELMKVHVDSRLSFGSASDLSETYTTLANLHEAEKRPGEALVYYEKARAIFADLVARFPKNQPYQAELARSLNNLGLARANAGKTAEGRVDVERGREIRERLLADQSLNIDRRADLARSYYHLARIQSLDAKATEATASILKAEELYAGIPPKGPEDLYFQACLKAMRAGLLGAGKADGELSPTDRAERQRGSDDAMKLLKQAFEAGYSNPDRLKDYPPLESLRSRPDFQELLNSKGQRAR